MEIVFRIINMYLFFIFGRMIFNLVISLKNKSSRTNIDSKEKVQSANNWNAQIHKIKDEINTHEMVKDEVCDTFVKKEQAYIVVDDNEEKHYFCSWECRQKHIDEKKKANVKFN